MSARFRIRTSHGQELSFASYDMFSEFVRSGDLSPDDVVYDAATKEWASARTHPVVLQIELSAEDAAESEGAARSEETLESESEAVPAGGDEFGSGGATTAELPIGLDLTPAPQGLTPEEESAVFVARMEAERASQIDPDENVGVQAFTMEQGSTSIIEAPRQPPREVPRGTAPPRVEQQARERERTQQPRWEPQPPLPRAEPEPPKPTKKRGGGAGWKYAPFVILVSVLAAAGVYFGPELLESPAAAGTDAEPQAPAVSPATPPLIPSTEEALRARARERFLTATQAELRDLDQVPEVWLRGVYLAAPSDYSAVRAVWEEYLTTIREVRARDDERYQAAYVRALDDARVADSVRTTRLATAGAVFRAAAPRRAVHYDRVEALALAAIQGHDALVRAEGTIAYQPATGPAVSADPVIEAVGRSREAQALLDQVLDLILGHVHEVGGPGETANVREWVWDGLLDAVAS